MNMFCLSGNCLRAGRCLNTQSGTHSMCGSPSEYVVGNKTFTESHIYDSLGLLTEYFLNSDVTCKSYDNLLATINNQLPFNNLYPEHDISYWDETDPYPFKREFLDRSAALNNLSNNKYSNVELGYDSCNVNLLGTPDEPVLFQDTHLLNIYMYIAAGEVS